MSISFYIVGPYEVPTIREKNGKTIQTGCADFWIKNHIEDLSNKFGCYVFCLKAPQGYTPFYVGKTKAKFKNEIFQISKIAHYQKAFTKRRIGKPHMFLVVQNEGNLPRVKAIAEIEKLLIEVAYSRNPELTNKQGIKIKWSIDGIMRSKGNPTKSAKLFKQTLKW